MAQCKAWIIKNFMADCARCSDVPSHNERAELFSVMFGGKEVSEALTEYIANGVINANGSLRKAGTKPEERSEA